MIPPNYLLMIPIRSAHSLSPSIEGLKSVIPPSSECDYRRWSLTKVATPDSGLRTFLKLWRGLVDDRRARVGKHATHYVGTDSAQIGGQPVARVAAVVQIMDSIKYPYRLIGRAGDQ